MSAVVGAPFASDIMHADASHASGPEGKRHTSPCPCGDVGVYTAFLAQGPAEAAAAAGNPVAYQWPTMHSIKATETMRTGGGRDAQKAAGRGGAAQVQPVRCQGEATMPALPSPGIATLYQDT